MKKNLAIIIPAYKPDFFRQTLNSISSQTNKNFCVYIGDDCSPFDLETIVDEFSYQIDIKYYRFAENLGGSNLVGHWERCINLAQEEKWIWLFSDDDLMPANCVDCFYKTIESLNTEYELYRFNVATINHLNEPITKIISNPPVESSIDFLTRVFTFKTKSFAVEYIFSRDIYTKSNGFVNFPAAWASDNATWALFGKNSGIYSIPGATVNWRYSGLNISSINNAVLQDKKIKAAFQFVNWTKEQFGSLISDKLFINWSISNFINTTGKYNFTNNLFFFKNLYHQTTIRKKILAKAFIKSNIGLLKTLIKKVL